MDFLQKSRGVFEELQESNQQEELAYSIIQEKIRIIANLEEIIEANEDLETSQAIIPNKIAMQVNSISKDLKPFTIVKKELESVHKKSA